MEKKTERLQLRMTSACKDRLHVLALSEGKSMAEFLEELINAYYCMQISIKLTK